MIAEAGVFTRLLLYPEAAKGKIAAGSQLEDGGILIEDVSAALRYAK